MGAFSSNILPSETVAVVGPVTTGEENLLQKLEETNLLLRAVVVLLCNMNDINPTDAINLAASLTGTMTTDSSGSVLGLQA